MSDLSPHARDVLASARTELAPDAERIARGRDRLLAATAITATATAAGTAIAHATTTSAAATGAATTTTATATTATATVGATTATATVATVATTTAGITGVKLVAIGAGLAVVTGGGLVVVPRALESEPARPAIRAEAPARTPMPAPDRPAPPSAAPPSAAPPVAAIDDGAIDPDMIELEPMADEAPARPRASRVRDPGAATAATPATEPGSAPAPAVDPLTRELALLRAARAGWKSGATVEALSSIATYQREFPRGQLAEEAAALELDLLCAAGRTDEAARNRARFLARWPASALRARVERPCAAR